MLALLAHPAQLAALRADRALLPGAIEEMLRFVPPVVQFRRTLTRDAELGGQRLRAGEKVVMFYPAANRDEAVFAEPGRFDLRRAPNPHLAFGGGGAHYCLGANLARLEIRCLFDAVLDRLDAIELAGPVERLHSWFIDGPRRMPVRFRATR
jgi:cholest-4-en-3-one 26-monooxygenase